MGVGFRQIGLVRGRNASLTNDFAGVLVYFQRLDGKNVGLRLDFFEEDEITFDVRHLARHQILRF